MPGVQPSLRDLCKAGHAFPTLKRWAIVGRSLRDSYMPDHSLDSFQRRPSALLPGLRELPTALIAPIILDCTLWWGTIGQKGRACPSLYPEETSSRPRPR